DQRGGRRRPLPRGHRARHHPDHPDRAATRPVRAIMTLPRRHRFSLAAILGVLLVALGLVPTLFKRDDAVDFVFLTLLSITLAESWNIVGGYAGQVNLGHAAFFGAGALVTRTLWAAGTNVFVAMLAGAAVAVLFGLAVGVPAFRLRGAYFAIG